MSQVRSNRPAGSGPVARPIGVTIICALNVLGIVAGFFLGMVLLGTPQAWLGLLMWLLIPLNIAVILGLWRMRRWGLWLAVAVNGLSLSLSLLRLDLLGMVIPGVVVASLLAIRRKFA